MASNALPVPAPLEIHDSNAADKWRKFLAAWENYALATELGDKPQSVKVATLLTVIGEDGREVYSTLRDWAQDGDDRRIVPVLRKFAEYCQPRKNVPFERYKFNKRMQESGESYEQYKTTLRKLSEARKNARVKRRHARIKVRQRKSVGTAVDNMADSRRSSARLSGNHVTVAANKITSRKSVDRNGQATREIR